MIFCRAVWALPQDARSSSRVARRRGGQERAFQIVLGHTQRDARYRATAAVAKAFCNAAAEVRLAAYRRPEAQDCGRTLNFSVGMRQRFRQRVTPTLSRNCNPGPGFRSRFAKASRDEDTTLIGGRDHVDHDQRGIGGRPSVGGGAGVLVAFCSNGLRRKRLRWRRSMTSLQGRLCPITKVT